MRVRDRVAIGWIDPGVVDSMFALQLMNVCKERGARIAGVLHVECSGMLSRSRNELVAQYLQDAPADTPWLLMIDSDEQLDLAGFDKLIATAHDTERPIVSGLYFAAWPGDLYPSPVPTIYDRIEGSRYKPIYDYEPNAVIPIDAAGTGCLLIHRSVLERMRENASQHEGANYCFFRDMPVNQDWLSEDFYFCALAQQLGFVLHAHTGVTLPHRKRYWLTESHHLHARGLAT